MVNPAVVEKNVRELHMRDSSHFANKPEILVSEFFPICQYFIQSRTNLRKNDISGVVNGLGLLSQQISVDILG